MNRVGGRARDTRQAVFAVSAGVLVAVLAAVHGCSKSDSDAVAPKPTPSHTQRAEPKYKLTNPDAKLIEVDGSAEIKVTYTVTNVGTAEGIYNGSRGDGKGATFQLLVGGRDQPSFGSLLDDAPQETAPGHSRRVSTTEYLMAGNEGKTVKVSGMGKTWTFTIPGQPEEPSRGDGTATGGTTGGDADVPDVDGPDVDRPGVCHRKWWC